jgi:hypothetical protein
MSVKAVHLELVSDLLTNAFLAALDRFVSRRGVPSDIYSDNRTNYVGAVRQLKALFDDPEMQASTSSHVASKWHLNPPGASHFGGLWEAAIESAKSHIRRVIGNQVPRRRGVPYIHYTNRRYIKLKTSHAHVSRSEWFVPSYTWPLSDWTANMWSAREEPNRNFYERSFGPLAVGQAMLSIVLEVVGPLNICLRYNYARSGTIKVLTCKLMIL